MRALAKKKMQAQTLNCPNCGAAISSDSPQCRYCESKLATVACPSCFGMMFIGSKYCPHCGAAPAENTPAPLSVLNCPRCKTEMTSVTIGAEPMRECERCGGLWVEVAVFEKICAHKEEQSAVLGGASVAPPHQVSMSQPNKISYAPCPQCGQLMNRINFARCSNVIVDVCKGHGTWFDRDELREIVEFIRGGGLEVSRQKEKHEIEFERQQLERDRMVAASLSDAHGFSYADEDRIGGLSAAHGLLKFLIE
ncbi:MAG TPA: zf-TFIIB domain-containing protein [Pyrinomonadaceae bacterium]|nr:zf-TFIIB domain-containing protein [Pyrinomonadaceae bacterium]